MEYISLSKPLLELKEWALNN